MFGSWPVAQPPAAGDPAGTPALFTAGGIAACCIALAAAGTLFVLDPALDLEVARIFYAGSGMFVGHTPAGEALRRLFYWLPFVVFTGYAGLYIARRAGRRVFWSPTGRGLLVLTLSLALGPGLLVNTVLKDHSHRPRPAQVVEFGGTLPFEPFYRFDGACRSNCSFVSGEGSAAFWCIAPALLAPFEVRAAALVAALAFGAAASGLRIAFGGHFLSDTIFAALFTWLVTAAVWRAIFRAQTVRDIAA